MDDHLQGEPTAGQHINLGLIASAVQKHTSVADFLRSPGATGSHAAGRPPGKISPSERPYLSAFMRPS